MVPLELTAERSLALLHRMTTALAGAITTSEVATAMFAGIVTELGSGSAGLWLLDEAGTHLYLAEAAGFQPTVEGRFARIPLDAEVPGPVVVRTGEPVTYSSTDERDRAWPALRGVPSAMGATAVLPLTVRGRTFGCVAIAFSEQREFSAAEIQFFSALGEQCALALDRARLYDAEREGRETLEFLADATRIMISAARPDEVLRQLVGLAVPRLADWCAVHVAVGEVLMRQAVEAVDPLMVEELLPSVGVALDSEAPVARAFARGEPQAFAGGLSVPIVARGEILGAMTIGFADGEERAGPRRQYAVTGLAARAAVALDNASRYQEEHQRAEMLTQALLPATLPMIPGFRYTTRYVPSSGAVCGDWYDAMALDGDRFLLGVGDAAGHGLAAASVMAQLRNAARGLAVAGRDPGQLLGDLSILAGEVDTECFATVTYAHLDTVTGSLSWSSAGHLPPLIVDGDGAHFVDLVSGPPLGIQTGAYPEDQIALAAGDLVVLFTDGVVERRGESIDVGLERLRKLAETVGTRGVEEVADEIVRELCQGHEDDCSLVVLRRE